MYRTYEEAEQALQTAAMDVAGDMGEEAVEAGWGDLVRSIASCCTNSVGAELLRRNGLGA